MIEEMACVELGERVTVLSGGMRPPEELARLQAHLSSRDGCTWSRCAPRCASWKPCPSSTCRVVGRSTRETAVGQVSGRPGAERTIR